MMAGVTFWPRDISEPSYSLTNHGAKQRGFSAEDNVSSSISKPVAEKSPSSFVDQQAASFYSHCCNPLVSFILKLQP